mmetsp:Transcript_18343/g.25218  ORF Transcript_18343/g.25218 Transcript_18343/m.25218 type:complete len:238 (+) Transcript_18343:692-1405(+)
MAGRHPDWRPLLGHHAQMGAEPGGGLRRHVCHHFLHCRTLHGQERGCGYREAGRAGGVRDDLWPQLDGGSGRAARLGRVPGHHPGFHPHCALLLRPQRFLAAGPGAGVWLEEGDSLPLGLLRGGPADPADRAAGHPARERAYPPSAPAHGLPGRDRRREAARREDPRGDHARARAAREQPAAGRAHRHDGLRPAAQGAGPHPQGHPRRPLPLHGPGLLPREPVLRACHAPVHGAGFA